jgi:hypothetical protein
VGVVLIVANVYAGVTDAGYAWPFAAYPSFEGLALAQIDLPEVAAHTSTDGVIYLNAQSFGQRLSVERFWGLAGQLSATQDDRSRSIRLQTLWILWSENDPRIKSADTIVLSRLTLSTVPEMRTQNPIRRTQLFAVRVSNFRAVASSHDSDGMSRRMR